MPEEASHAPEHARFKLQAGPPRLALGARIARRAALALRCGPPRFDLPVDPPTMTTYYVRQSGADTAAGTSAGAAYRTIGKFYAVAAAGDVGFVGAGIYRETISLTTAGAAVGGAITGISFSGTTATVTTTSTHGLAVGQWVCVTGVVGCSGVNGFWQVTAVNAGAKTYAFVSAAAGGTWASGGATEQLIALVADVDGSNTGDAGMVTLTAKLTADAAPGSSTVTFNLNGKAGQYVQGLIIGSDNSGSGRTNVDGTTTNATFVCFRQCMFPSDNGQLNPIMSYTGLADVSAHWLLDQCIFAGLTGGVNAGIQITMPTTATAADYNLDFVIRNCLSIGIATFCTETTSGASSHKPGGVRFENCTLFGSSTFTPPGGALSMQYPTIILNSLTTGQFSGSGQNVTLEDFNQMQVLGSRGTGTTIGAATALLMGIGAGAFLGNESFVGAKQRPAFSPTPGSPMLGWGQAEVAIGSPATITDDATVGTIAWSNPGNASYLDATYATNVVTLAADTHYLNFQGLTWDRPIPSNAVIDGIRIGFVWLASAASDLTPSGTNGGVKLIKGGAISGSLRQNSTTLQSSAQTWYFGGPADLWGLTLAPSDVNGATFGFVLCLHGTAAATADVDYAYMMVYYHLPVPTVNVDLANRPRPAGNVLAGPIGTATSGGAATVTDSGATWGVNQWVGWIVGITSGTGSGQYKLVKSNTLTAITVISNWATQPDSTSHYQLYLPGGAMCETGKFTSATASTATCSSASWLTNQWIGYTVEITGGTGAGQKFVIGSSTSTQLTIGTTQTTIWTTTPDSTSTYAIYRGAYGAGPISAPACGCYELHDTGAKETVIVDVGSALNLVCPGDQCRPLNCASGARTYTVKYRSDAGVTPTVTVKANPQVGLLADVSASGSTGQGSFTTLTLNFTTTSAGEVMIVFSCTGTAGNKAYFDTEALT